MNNSSTNQINKATKKYFVKLNDELLTQNISNSKYLLVHLWLMEHVNMYQEITFTLDILITNCGENYKSYNNRTIHTYITTLRTLIDDGIWSVINNVEFNSINKHDIITFKLKEDKYFSNWMNKWFPIYFEDITTIKNLYAISNQGDINKLIALWCWMMRKHVIAKYNQSIQDKIAKKIQLKQEKEAQLQITTGELNEGDSWEKEWGINESNAINNDSNENDKNNNNNVDNALKNINQTNYLVDYMDREPWFRASGLEIQEYVGISESNVIRYINFLGECGLIKVCIKRCGKKSERWIKVIEK